MQYLLNMILSADTARSNVFAPLVIAALLIAQLSSVVFAGEIYIYRTPDGRKLFTDKKIQNPLYKSLNHKREKRKASYSPAKTEWQKNQYDTYISYAAKAYKLDFALIKAVIHVESAFDTYAVSRAGAQGLMQLMPATASLYKVSNPHNAKQNIMGGANYLKYLLKKYKGNRTLSLAAYNAGETNVAKYGGVPPFKETKQYVVKVENMFKHYKKTNTL